MLGCLDGETTASPQGPRHEPRRPERRGARVISIAPKVDIDKIAQLHINTAEGLSSVRRCRTSRGAMFLAILRIILAAGRTGAVYYSLLPIEYFFLRFSRHAPRGRHRKMTPGRVQRQTSRLEITPFRSALAAGRF